MKRTINSLLAAAVVLFIPCTCYADMQEEFLKDMAAGQAARWEITENASEEELSDMGFRYVYLDAELEYLEKYNGVEFDNEKFNELAHLYTSGVKLQREAVGFYTDYPYVFESEWESGYMMRGYSVVGLHDYYGLEVPEDKLEECRNYIDGIGAEQTVTLTEYGRTLEMEHLLDLEETSISPFNDENDLLELKVRNVSETEMRDMHLTINLLDAGGDILKNLSLYNNGTLKAGQGVTVSTTYPKAGAESIEFMTVSYTKEDGTYVDNTLEGFEKININDLLLTKPDEPGTLTDSQVSSDNAAFDTEAVENNAASLDQVQEPSQDIQESTESAVAKADASGTEKNTIERAIKNRVKENYSNTDFDRISINEDYGTEDNPNDWIVLVYLTWNVNNSQETSEKVLQMYSDDIAAFCAEQFKNVQEISVFWKVPHLTENTSKWSYERRSNGMYQTDNMLGW